MEIGLVDLMDGSPERDPAFIRRFAQAAEAHGFSGIWLPEHVVFFERYDSAYPYPDAPDPDAENGTHSHNATVNGTARVEAAVEQGLLDVLQTALAICSATTRLRVDSSVLLLPLRNTRLFVQELTSVTELTGGRFDLGCGVGWSAEEFAACGADFAGRGKRCEAQLRELQELWSASELSADMSRPRLLYGGNSAAAIRRGATAATGWYPWNLSVADFSAGHQRFCAAIDAAGRDRREYHVVVGVRFSGRISTLAELARGYRKAGADGINISLRMTNDNFEDVMTEVSQALELV